MANNGNKLELTWTNKDKSLFYDLEKKEYIWVDKKDPRVSEPRILVKKSHYGDPKAPNMLIKGDNLLALKALLPEFVGKIKLVYIDPPYNTGNAFSHYDDGLEHSLWLGLMRTRIETLYDLLDPKGSMWISIDDDECHYLKVMCDEIFGRNNFVANVIWQKKYTRANDTRWFSDNHDHILVYAKDKENWRPNPLPRTASMDERYKNPDNDSRGAWMTQPLHAKSGKDSTYVYKFKNGVEWKPPAGTFPRYSKESLRIADEEGRIWFGANGTAVPRMKKYLEDMGSGVVPMTIWPYTEVGSNDDARKEVKNIDANDVFATPKPEKLLIRIIDLATNDGDWVLDSFAGSGTTGAVAHKKNRKWLMVEIGNHAQTHIIPRLNAVISGSDLGLINSMLEWKGGGGFGYYELGESLFTTDDSLKLTQINPNYFNGPLTQAVCKIEGFKVIDTHGQLHGKSGKHYAHVTEYFVTQDYVDVLANQIKDGEFLTIYCKKRARNLKLNDDVEVKLIPEALLSKFSI